MKAVQKIKNIAHDMGENLENRTYRLAMFVGVMIFGLGVLGSYAYSESLSKDQADTMETYQKEKAQEIESYILNKLSTYEELIIAGAALHKTNNVVTRNDWRDIYYNLRIPERAPELLGYGYAEYVTADTLGSHTMRIRQSGISDYTISPDGERDEYAPIKFIEPLNELNKKAIGYDMFSESIRRQAMIAARDSGEPALTAPVITIQDGAIDDGLTPKSLLMYYPVYKEGRFEQTDSRTLVGYSYVVFRVSDLMSSFDVDLGENVENFYIQDPESTDDEILSAVRSNLVTSNDTEMSNYEKDIDVLSRSWKIGLSTRQIETSPLLSPTRVFIRGVFISFLLGALAFLYLLKRSSDTNKKHAEEIQRTKDELLALASHQLRTPATGVRQYVGMLTQGYFGELDKEQLSIAKKAYETNERQLEIIDQLLYVAKADAGQLSVNFGTIDIVAITKDVIFGCKESSDAKNIKVEYKGKKKLLCSGDKRYVRMIVENLLSNAIKYSYANSKIVVSLRQRGNQLSLKFKDKGVGIAEADLSKLFLKFSRIESPLSRTEGGSGLGLFLAQKLAEAHAGQIEVSSKQGVGSTFTLHLPLRRKNAKSVVQLTE